MHQNLIIQTKRFYHLILISLQLARTEHMNKEILIPADFIYLNPPTKEVRRYELMKFSSWRMKLYQQLQPLSRQQIQKLVIGGSSLDQIFPVLCHTDDQVLFYQNFLQSLSSTKQQDIISHFISRMLYSRQLKNHQKFVQMERTILQLKLQRLQLKEGAKMRFLKQLVHLLTNQKLKDLDIQKQQFRKNSYQIMMTKSASTEPKQNNHQMYMKIKFELGEAALRRRKSFASRGYVFANIQTTIQIVLAHYTQYLKDVIVKSRSKADQICANDIQNQIKPFMDKAIDCLNQTAIDQTEINSEFKLNGKNIQAVYRKYFPPCMLNLTQKLKQNHHLKHDGRRQLWLFFKGCGMDVHDNKQFFRKYMQQKVSVSDMKNHLYNIQHAYGLVGKKQSQRPKMCRNIITQADPKKDQHHGCPFKHWGKQQLSDYLRKNYTINQDKLNQIMFQKSQNYFQVACGRLFEATMTTQNMKLPEQITNELGKSPHQYFTAGMEATSFINNGGKRKENKTSKKPNGQMNSNMKQMNESAMQLQF